MTKTRLLIVSIIVFCLAGSAFGMGDWLFASIRHGCLGNALGVANPAAIYCSELGYQYDIIDDPEGQRDICTFPDGSSCDAWEFLKGQCGQEYSYCARNGYDMKTFDDGMNPLSIEYAVCFDKDDKEVGSVVELSGIMEIAVKGTSVSRARIPSSIQKTVIPLRDVDLPPTFDWRDQHDQNWITSVKNQGGCGSCTMFASVALTEATRNVHRNDPNIDIDLSEQYLVADCHPEGNCCGGWCDLVLDYMKTQGVPDDGCMLYYDGNGCSCDGGCANCTYRFEEDCSDRTCSDRCADWESRLEYVSTWESLGSFNIAAIKQYLVTNGPVAVYIGIGDDFGGHFEGDVYRCDNDYGTNHAVLIVGYNDYAGYWIIKNSWGALWGTSGYFNMGYGECSIGEDAFIVTDFVLVDTDGDGIGNACDNCPDISNDNQLDTDNDTYGDACDNCPAVYNPDQQNSDTDEFGDVCDNCPEIESPCCDDIDNDDVGDLCDNCPLHYNPFQEDYDGDNIGNQCDYLCGDFDGDELINILDVVYMIDYVYKNGIVPEPLERVNANGDGAVNILDIVYLVNKIYKNGPDPHCAIL